MTNKQAFELGWNTACERIADIVLSSPQAMDRMPNMDKAVLAHFMKDPEVAARQLMSAATMGLSLGIREMAITPPVDVVGETETVQ